MDSIIDIPALWDSLAGRVSEVFERRDTDPFHVYYDYGRYLEVTRNLIAKDGGVNSKGEKYPLIWVVVPYTVTDYIVGYGCDINDIEIIIATPTIQESTTPQRIEANFRTRLWPIYNELRNQIDRSGYFDDIDLDSTIKRIDQPYWDGKEKGGANLFTDFIDAVQLKGIRLKVNEQTCERFRLISGT